MGGGNVAARRVKGTPERGKTGIRKETQQLGWAMDPRSMSRGRLLIFLCPIACGCGGGAATLYPAHTLGPNQATVGAGVSGNFAFSGGQSVVQGPPGASVAPNVDPEQAYVDDSVRTALLAPGIAPWVGARVGLGGQNEAGLTYTGRSARLDARHAFQNEEFALSIGLGASGVLVHPGSYHPPDSSTPAAVGRFTDPNAKLIATGWGLELPVVAGWRSSASVVSVWAGARAGFERVFGELPVLTPPPPDPKIVPLPLFADVGGSRFWAGGLVGFAIGIKPIWVAVELDAAYQSMTANATFPAESGPPGSPLERKSSMNGVTLAPTGAIIGKLW
jgi:hypothetical protein